MQTLLLTIAEVAEALRLGRTKVNELLYSGQIESLKIGRRRYIRRDEVEAFVERRQEAQRAAADE